MPVARQIVDQRNVRSGPQALSYGADPDAAVREISRKKVCERPPEGTASLEGIQSLPVLPAIASPIPAALMFAEPIVLARAPLPIIIVNDDPGKSIIGARRRGDVGAAASGDVQGRAAGYVEHGAQTSSVVLRAVIAASRGGVCNSKNASSNITGKYTNNMERSSIVVLNNAGFPRPVPRRAGLGKLVPRFGSQA